MSQKLPETAVPAGYKQTEVGVIPEDWEVVELYKIYAFKQGLQCSIENQYKNYFKRSIRFIRIIDLTNKNEPPRYINDPGKSYHVDESDLFMVRYGSPGLLGIGYKGIIANNLFKLSPKIKLTNKFYYFYLSKIKSTFENMSGSSTMPAINFSSLNQLTVLLPPSKEQTAIANALSDVDALISEQEKLIAKKQAIKTATMQQLLTGRTRLPQFALRDDGAPKGTKPSELGEIPEDWEVYRFEQNFTIYAGGDVPKDSFSRIKTDTYPYPIFANAIQGRGLYGYTSHKRSKPDSVTITARGYLGHAEYRNEPFFPIVRLLVMEPVGTVDSRFATYAINELVEFPTESTGVPQLTAPQVGKFSISAPADVNEQTAIATILSDMDAEIQALEQHLGKIRQIKQGMMQELLTGKTRLIKGEAHG